MHPLVTAYPTIVALLLLYSALRRTSHGDFASVLPSLPYVIAAFWVISSAAPSTEDVLAPYRFDCSVAGLSFVALVADRRCLLDIVADFTFFLFRGDTEQSPLRDTEKREWEPPVLARVAIASISAIGLAFSVITSS